MAVMLLTMYDVHGLCAHEGMFAVPALDIERLGQLRCHDSGHGRPHCAVQCGTTEVTKMQDLHRRGRHGRAGWNAGIHFLVLDWCDKRWGATNRDNQKQV